MDSSEKWYSVKEIAHRLPPVCPVEPISAFYGQDGQEARYPPESEAGGYRKAYELQRAAAGKDQDRTRRKPNLRAQDQTGNWRPEGPRDYLAAFPRQNLLFLACIHINMDGRFFDFRPVCPFRHVCPVEPISAFYRQDGQEVRELSARSAHVMIANQFLLLSHSFSWCQPPDCRHWFLSCSTPCMQVFDGWLPQCHQLVLHAMAHNIESTRPSQSLGGKMR